MDHLSTADGILSRIGALELGGDWESHGDATLEAAGANLAGGPSVNIGCGPPPPTAFCGH
jgi:hypothetical protein